MDNKKKPRQIGSPPDIRNRRSKIQKEVPSSRIELETFGYQSCYQECHIKGYETDVMTKLDHEGYH